MVRYFLMPTNTNKSFNGKAVVVMDGDELILESYLTPVCKITPEKEFVRLWGGYSPTTARHINSFREQNGFSKINKKQWDKMEVII